MEDYSQKATYYLYNQKGNYKLVKTSEHLHTLLISFMMFQEFSRSLLSIICSTSTKHRALQRKR